MNRIDSSAAAVVERSDVPAVRSAHRLRQLLVVGLLCSNLLVFALSAYTIHQGRLQHELLAETTTRNVAGAIEKSLTNSVSRIDLALRGVGDEIERQLAGGGIDEKTMNVFLSRLEQRLPEVEAIRVADADGLVILGKGVSRQARASWADREYFTAHRNEDDHRVRVAPPRMGRVARQPIVGFSLRYNFPDGRFAGVISAPMAVEKFSHLMSGYLIGEHGTIVLRYADAGLITRLPPLPDKPVGEIGNQSISPELRRIVDSGTDETTYYTPTSADGYQRIVTFRRLQNAPLMFVVGAASVDYLADWWRETCITAAMAGGFLLLSLVLGGISFRMISVAERRERMLLDRETELERHRHHLEELVGQRTAELMATEARASHVIASSADGLFGVDPQGCVTFINPAACALLGYTPEQVIGRSAHDLFHQYHPDGSPYPADACPAVAALQQGDKVRVDDEVYWHADGHPVPVMYAVHPIVEDGRITGSVTSFVDMSEQRAAVRAREEALQAAENLARVRREFLANMSHEIRTPLNGVLGFADIGHHHYQNPEKARNAFAKIIASGNRLLGVINDVLDFSKIEAGKFVVEETAICPADVVERAVELVQEKAREKGVALTASLAPDVPAGCLSDPLRLGQVLLNLLSNAVKFTEVGEVSLAVSWQDGRLVFRIVDTGIGMSEVQLAELFSPFHQADASATRRFGGTGLGLAISKRILEAMGGDIRVDSRKGVGSTFEFRVPCRLPDAGCDPGVPAAAIPDRASGLLRGVSVLVVEDDTVNQAVLQENLVEDGANVVLTSTGDEALACVRDRGGAAFDIVLMDLQLPEMDGYEATRRIREIAPELPIIAQSAHAFREERERCLAAGMAEHIAKPIDPDELVRVVQAHARARTGILTPGSRSS